MNKAELISRVLNCVQPENFLILPFLGVWSSSISFNLPTVEKGDDQELKHSENKTTN
jgi:hypothetical protein